MSDPEVSQFVERHFHYRSGWFKLWRQTFYSEIWTSCPHSWFRVFVALLGCARHEESTTRVKGQTVKLAAGSLTIGSIEFSKFCGVSRQQLRSALEYLVATKTITISVTTRFSIVTICNWEAYQACSEDDNQQNTQSATTAITTGVTTAVTTLKEVKNIRNTLTLTSLKQHPLVVDLAGKLHGRHPVQRRGAISEVVSQIAKILKAHESASWSSLCEQIDQNHIAACAQYSWQKDGGEFAKGLVNWLAPSMRRWEEKPPAVNGVAGHGTGKKLLM